jgi:hypothetical protein
MTKRIAVSRKFVEGRKKTKNPSQNNRENASIQRRKTAKDCQMRQTCQQNATNNFRKTDRAQDEGEKE